jgi:hypothetical protein
MELHAPAAAPYTVVPLHQTREVRPRLLVERLDVEAGHRREASREVFVSVLERSADGRPGDPAAAGRRY